LKQASSTLDRTITKKVHFSARCAKLGASYRVQRWPDASLSLLEEALMYARLTTFRVKPDKVDEMRQWRERNESKIYTQPGLREWIGMMDENGEFFVLSVFDDEKAARDAMPAVRSLWSDMAPMLEGEPTARFMQVLAAKNLALQGVVMA